MEEVLCLLEENIKAKVIAGANIPTKLEHAWRDIPDLIRRLITAIPPSVQANLILDLQKYSDMVCAVAPTVIKATYTRDIPLQTMRMHIMSIMKVYHVPIENTKCWTIELCWQRRVVEIFHNVRYDDENVNYPKSPTIDD